MLTITLPANYIPERTYVIDTLFGHFLGLPYVLLFSENPTTSIQLENGHELIIEDAFFSQIPEAQGYLDSRHLPTSILNCTNSFMVEPQLPILYGTSVTEVQDKQIYLGIDVIATLFFMLSRWEELVQETTDQHQRFCAQSSIAYRHQFLSRPIVNEMVEMIWNMLCYLGLQEPRKKREYRLVLTHDVDFLYRWKNGLQMFRSIAGDVVHRRNWRTAQKTIHQIGRMSVGRAADPYDTFEWMMDLSEEANIQSRFYWMSGGKTIHDNHYQITETRAKEISRQMRDRGHLLGFHPSYDSYQDARQWEMEKEQLEQELGIRVTEGRQHYLRFCVPDTWRIWEGAGMQVDSTLGYADQYGFRAGVCYEYPVFDLKSRTTLQLLERPLIAMDVTFLDAKYLNLTSEEIVETICRLQQTCANYAGDFVLLWHNSSLASQEERDLYQTVLKHVAKPARSAQLRGIGI